MSNDDEEDFNMQGLLNEILALRGQLIQKEEDALLAANLGQHLLSENARLQSELVETNATKGKIIKDLSTQLDHVSERKPRSQSILSHDALLIELKKDNSRLQVNCNFREVLKVQRNE
jgi:hypothetical protein